MEDILDNTTEEREKPIFARLALLSSIGAICGFAFISKMIAGTILAYQSLEQPPMTVIRITQILTLASVLSIAISYIKREPRSWLKGIATFLVILIISLFIGAVSFYSYIENSR